MGAPKGPKDFVVRLAITSSNIGFGGACNFGAREARGKYLIFLNADTILSPNWVTPIVQGLQKPGVGIVGNLQIRRQGGRLKGTIDSAGSEWSWEFLNFLHIGRHIWNGKPLKRPYREKDAPDGMLSPRECEMVTGCCLGISKNLFEQVGGFDQRYRIGYWEDTELNLMVRELGYQVLFEPASRIYHVLGHSKVSSHPFQAQNKQLFLDKWVNTGRIDALVRDPRPMKPMRVESVLLKRQAARGDVLLAAAVAPALKKKFPGCRLMFETSCSEMLKGNPFIDEVVDKASGIFQYTCDLNLIYERRPHTNILDAYAQEAGVRREDCQLYVHRDSMSLEAIKTETYRSYLLFNYVVIHAGRTNWVGRNWQDEKFTKLAGDVQRRLPVVCVGNSSDQLVPCALDLRGKTTVAQLADVIQRAKLFVGIDSMPFHVCQAVGTPAVCFFGSIKPELRIVNENITAVRATDLTCLGCHHRRPPLSTVTDTCERGDLACETGVSVKQMLSAINERMQDVVRVH